MKAPCPYFGECGGCRLQELEYHRQIQDKKTTLQRLLGVEDLPVYSAKPYGYRNRLDMIFHPHGLGFRRRGSWDKIVDVENCLIAEPALNALVLELRTAFPRPDAFDVRKHTGTLRYAVLRTTRAQTSISFILNPDSPGRPAVEAELRKFARGCSADNVLMGYVQATTDASTTEQYEVLRGKPTLTESIAGADLEYHTQGFFQVNHAVSEAMLQYVREIAAAEPGAELLDLYGGVGSFGVTLAPNFSRVTVMENHAGSIASAHRNLAAAGCRDSRAVVDDAAEADRLEYRRPLIVVSDPPRSGMHPAALRRLTELAPAKILYISCNPSALAEELPQFRGYRLGRVALFDMFPQTPHFEAVVELLPQGPLEPVKIPLISLAARLKDSAGDNEPAVGSGAHTPTVFRLSTNPGLEEIAAQELRELAPHATVTVRPGGLQGYLLVQPGTPANLPETEILLGTLMRSASVQSVLTHLDHFAVDRDAETPQRIAAALADLEVPGLAEAESFRVTTERSGTHEFRSEQVQRAMGARLVQRYGTPVKLESPALDLRVDVRERHCLVGVDHGQACPPGRTIRVFQPRVTLNRVVAYCMLRAAGVLARPDAQFTLLDPFAGSGTVLMEAGALLPKAMLHGIELDPTTVAGAQRNIEAAGLSNRAVLECGDSRMLSRRVEPNSVEYIVTNPPFGVRIGRKTEFGAFYRDILREFAAVLKPGGTVAMLVGKSRHLFLEELSKHGAYQLLQSSLIETSGVFPELYVLRYRP